MLRWNKWCVAFSVWRNDNSSRFGKYLEVLFRDGVITGIDIHHSFIFTSNCCNLSSAQWALPFLLFQFWFWFSNGSRILAGHQWGPKSESLRKLKVTTFVFWFVFTKSNVFQKGVLVRYALVLFSGSYTLVSQQFYVTVSGSRRKMNADLDL